VCGPNGLQMPIPSQENIKGDPLQSFRENFNVSLFVIFC
jgi:hypothetical protein